MDKRKMPTIRENDMMVPSTSPYRHGGFDGDIRHFVSFLYFNLFIMMMTLWGGGGPAPAKDGAQDPCERMNAGGDNQE